MGSTALMQLLGCYEENAEARKEKIAALSHPSNAGARRELRKSLEHTEYEYMALGIESNQRYSSAAIVTDGFPIPEFERDPIIHYEPTTFPGARLPHVWLYNEIPGEGVSTLDICGKGGFAILTGVGGQGWVIAAQQVSKELSVPISSTTIGFGQEFTDPFFHWEDIRGVEEDGCILVRPDLFVGWRATKSMAGEESAKLREVMRQILGLDTIVTVNGALDAPVTVNGYH